MQFDVAEVASGVFQARTRFVSWVLVVDGAEVTLVDTGWPGDRERVLASLERLGRRASDVSAVVLTHAHPDHRGNARWMRERYDVPVNVLDAERAHALGDRVEEVSRVTLLRMAWRLRIARFDIEVIARMKALRTEYLDEVGTFCEGPVDVPGGLVCVPTPGHTSGHVVLHLPRQGVLLVGDALMTDHPTAGPGGVRLLPDFFNHDDEQAARSLERLRPLEADVVVPGHGPAFWGTPAAAVEQALAHRAAGRGGASGHR